MKNVGIFADISSLYRSVGKKFPGKKLDYLKLRDHLVGNDILFRAIGYGLQSSDEASKFIDKIQAIGFEPRYKQIKVIHGEGNSTRHIKPSWNIGMTLDVVQMVEKLDVVYLCSSDPELVPLVEYVKALGRKCVVASAGISRELKKSASSVIELGEDLIERPA